MPIDTIQGSKVSTIIEPERKLTSCEEPPAVEFTGGQGPEKQEPRIEIELKDEV